MTGDEEELTEGIVHIEIRCPIGPRELLMKLRSEGIATPIVDGNLMECYCKWCTKQARKSNPIVMRVLHLFDFAGELVETITVYQPRNQSHN